jgi:V8-like Glu-specific endopeptidase
MRKGIRAVGVLVASSALLLLPALSSASQADTTNGLASHKAATSSAEQQRVQRFWTKDRMRDAIPMDSLVRDAGRPTSEVKRGLPKVVKPTKPESDVGTQAFPEPGGPWSGGGKVVSTAGRVFFTYQGQSASCSGNAVTSANKSVVMTAGHCVKMDGAWHTNWAFVPAYDNGSTPHGTWTASETFATAQWEASEDINHDVGAAVVNPLDGRSLTDVVGGQGVAFNQARGQDMYAFGYPAADPYDGTSLIYCSDTVFDDPLLSQGIGMYCDMTGGASGGPWFLEFDESTGLGIQNSVNSFKINFINFLMFGPYFGDSAQDVYTRAQNA